MSWYYDAEFPNEDNAELTDQLLEEDSLINTAPPEDIDMSQNIERAKKHIAEFMINKHNPVLMASIAERFNVRVDDLIDRPTISVSIVHEDQVTHETREVIVKREDLSWYRRFITGQFREILSEEDVPDAECGTIIHCTFREIELIPALLAELEKRDQPTAEGIVAAYDAYADALEDEADEFWDSSAPYMLDAVSDALNSCAPRGMYFGSHPGNGSDFGFWPVDVIEQLSEEALIHANRLIDCEPDTPDTDIIGDGFSIQ